MRCEGGVAPGFSRSQVSTIQDAVSQLKLRSTILDGEIVALDKDGVPRFPLLQQWQKRPTAPVVLYLFDLLWSDGRDITDKTVLQRRDRLEQIINLVLGIQVGSYVENHGIDLYGGSPTKVRKVPQKCPLDPCVLDRLLVSLIDRLE
jgi:ATP-dependent DNA ligase